MEFVYFLKVFIELLLPVLEFYEREQQWTRQMPSIGKDELYQ